MILFLALVVPKDKILVLGPGLGLESCVLVNITGTAHCLCKKINFRAVVSKGIELGFRVRYMVSVRVSCRWGV